MPFQNFVQFGAAVCDAAGVLAPEFEPDDHGVMAFHMMIQDIVVNLVHLQTPEGDNDDAFLLVTFGSVPDDQELEVLRLLVEANFSMLSVDAPVFGVNPASGEVVLRQLVSLSRADGPGTFDTIVRLVELARQWRANPTLSQLRNESRAVDPLVFA